MHHTSYRLSVGALVALAFTSTALAAPHAETPDAGVTEATAQQLPAGINQVTGTLKAGTSDVFGIDPADADVFCFTLDAPVTGASIQVSPSGFDSNLLLLGGGFFGIWGDDDGGTDMADSGIVTDLAAGTYFIAVGWDDISAYDSAATDAGDVAWSNDDDELDPAVAVIPIALIGSRTSNTTAGEAYTIDFNFTTSEHSSTVGAKAADTAAQKLALENKVKKLKKKIKKAKSTTKSRKLKKKLKKLQKQLRALS